MSRTKATFVLGPAGSGKTHRCIQSVRRRLIQDPEGPTLLFLAPKQATFQIESQILASGELGGYTRLEILSFARLAERILSELSPGSFRILGEEGRIMVLRYLLSKHAKDLRAFRAAAGFPALARELSALLQDLGRQRIDAKKLDRWKEREELSPRLRNKLHDLALLSELYRQWLRQADLKDTESLLELAAERLRSETASSFLFSIEELWLDGFAEMTAQELALLAAVARRSKRANLCFCVDPGKPSNPSWLNLWATVDETWERCRQRIEELPGVEMEIVHLARDPERSRFSGSPTLRHLEAHWTTPKPLPIATADVEITACTDPETEVIHAARSILRSVREEGIRFRQITVIVRRLEGYATEIQQIFGRYQIPHFIDQRDSIRHHPAVILTQSALRLLAFDWRNADWFAALKTSLLGGGIEQTCHLENLALEFDIEGSQWRRALTSETCPHPFVESLEQHRQKAAAPFEELESQLFADGAVRNTLLSGTELAEAIRRFWERIDLADRLEKWDRPAAEADGGEPAVHAAAWQQLQAWLENVRLAFADMRRPLADWIAILENGLGNLTVGVIPPSADQVLVGAVDRTRNPEVELAMLFGLNESVFPARPRRHPLLTDADRKQLDQSDFRWLPPVKRRLAHERFYAYIACTRPRKKLAISYAEQDAEGRPLNPSSIIAHLQRLFPSVQTRRFARKHTVDGWTGQGRPPLHEAEHWSELIRPLFRSKAGQTADSEVEKLFHSLEIAPSLPPCSLPSEAGSERLSPAVAKILYTAADAKSADEAKAASNTLRSSASRLEQFAACPFQFFLRYGLKAEERNQRRLDAKALGSFQHEVLEKFHRRVQAQKRQWRDLSPQEARELVAQITANAGGAFQRGAFQKNEAARLSLETAGEKLQEFIAVTIQWMQQYNFDPHTAELSFGGKNDDIGPWMLPLEDGAHLSLAGKIDRLDVLRKLGGRETAAVIIDYKSGNASLDPVLLHNGIQLQLFIYLNAIAQHLEIAGRLKIHSLAPAGAFLVPLQGKAPRSSHRNDAQTRHADRLKAFQWNGRFSQDHLRQLDNRPDQAKGDQIAYALNKDGAPAKDGQSAMSPQAFREMTRRLEETVRNIGKRILAGDVAATPYKHKEKTPCAYCSYPAVCRIDAAAHPYRTLHSSAKEPKP